ncbi:hypothetical protein D5086_015555 [Populus alba]|uniref:Uncharacterized protein n=1 Tax=Populus alba TaxID=43335 RepID=A0ACC4BTJ0_POPAL
MFSTKKSIAFLYNSTRQLDGNWTLLRFSKQAVYPKTLSKRVFKFLFQAQFIVVSAFGSASSGTGSIPSTLFTTGIDSGILAKAFKTDVATIEKLKAGLAPKA